MRVLATSTANSGHFGPLLPVLRAWRDSGAEVLVVIPPGLVDAARGQGFAVRPGGEPPADELAEIWDRVPHASREEAAVLVNREIFGRLDTEAMLPAVEEACDSWRPDVVVHEPAEFAGPVAAERRGIPHLSVAIGLASVEAASIDIAAPVLHRYGDGFVDRLMRSPYLTRFPESVDPSPFPLTCRFRERASSAASTAPVASPVPAGTDGSRPLVYVSLGTVASGLPAAAAVFPALCRALDGLPVRALLTLGRAGDASVLGEVPDNVRVEEWVNQDAAIAAASLVVCHGGAGTTFGALAAGVPVVVVPLMADQPTNGRVAARAGAGVVVPPFDAEAGGAETLPARLRAAVEEVLGTASYPSAARRLAAEMARTPLVDDVLAALAAGPEAL